MQNSLVSKMTAYQRAESELRESIKQKEKDPLDVKMFNFENALSDLLETLNEEKKTNILSYKGMLLILTDKLTALAVSQIIQDPKTQWKILNIIVENQGIIYQT